MLVWFGFFVLFCFWFRIFLGSEFPTSYEDGFLASRIWPLLLSPPIVVIIKSRNAARWETHRLSQQGRWELPRQYMRAAFAVQLTRMRSSEVEPLLWTRLFSRLVFISPVWWHLSSKVRGSRTCTGLRSSPSSGEGKPSLTRSWRGEEVAAGAWAQSVTPHYSAHVQRMEAYFQRSSFSLMVAELKCFTNFL